MTQSPAFLSRYLQLATFLALLAFPIAGLAQDLPEGHPPIAHERASDAQGPNSKWPDSTEAKAAAPLLPPTSVTHHAIKVAGVPLDYTAEAGTIPLPGADGKSAANIFYVAYTREPKNAKRPITFVFNGELEKPLHDPSRELASGFGFAFGRSFTRKVAAMIELRTESSIDFQRDRLVLVNAGIIDGVRNVVVDANIGHSVFSDDGGHFYAGGGFKVVIGR